MKQIMIIIATLLIPAPGLMAQIRLPELDDRPAGLIPKKSDKLKHGMAYPPELNDFQWRSFPVPTTDEVTQASVAGDGSELVIHYRKPRPSLNIDEGIVDKWTGGQWAVQANLSNQCHEPDVDIDGSIVVATWYDDGYDFGYGTNVNGNWVSLTGTYLTKQWFPRAAMAMGFPYMSFACKYSDGMATNYDMLHILSPVGVGEKIELNGGWRVIYTSVGMRTHITGDDQAWYCVFSQQEFLYVMKGAIVDSQKEYADLGEGFRMYNPVSHPEIVLYKGVPVVGWFENANTEIYIAEWNGSAWMVLGQGTIPTGSLYSLRMSASASYLYVTYASTESDTAISVNLYDGEFWYNMPPVQDYLTSDIGTVDIAVHNEEPVVAFTENNLLKIKKFTSDPITHSNPVKTRQELFSCFPNPAHDVITIQTIEPGEYSVEISAITGQTIFSQTFSGMSLQLDLSSFGRGTYFIILRNGKHKTTRRILKL